MRLGCRDHPGTGLPRNWTQVLKTPWDGVSRQSLERHMHTEGIVGLDLNFYNGGKKLSSPCIFTSALGATTLRHRRLLCKLFTSAVRRDWVDATSATLSRANLVGSLAEIS